MLSKVPKEGYIDRLHYVNWDVLMLKACDRLDNLRHMEQATPEFRRKQVTETRQKYWPLFDRMVQDGVERENDASLTSRLAQLRDKVREETIRQEALLR
jgi:(p)ppGpp synthase/HD superfamily hydrolase